MNISSSWTYSHYYMALRGGIGQCVICHTLDSVLHVLNAMGSKIEQLII